MNKTDFTTCVVTLFLASVSISGCDRTTSKAPPSATATKDAHAGHDHSHDQHAGHDHAHDRAESAPTATAHADPAPATPPAQKAKATDAARLTLTGLTMSPDPEWVVVPFEAGAMAPVAVFSLPADDAVGGTSVPADAKPVEIRITHYPSMKGPQMDEMNIERWVGSVRRPDGTPATTEDAKITIKTVGHIRLTIVDISGTVMPMMGEQSAELSDQRLIAAIVDHPEGPHFVKALGPAATIAKWEQRILAFLDSAEVTP